MQHEIKTKHPLLDAEGRVAEPGWSREYLLEYNREAIQRDETEIKEWDYHIAMTREYAVAVSIANVGSTSRLSLHLMDFENKSYLCESDLIRQAGSAGIFMPRDVESSVHYQTERVQGHYEKQDGTCRVTIDFQDFANGKPLKAQLFFIDPGTDKMVIAIPYKSNPELFYYNYKVNGMDVQGTVEFDGRTYVFDQQTAMGTNDWGRGIWEHKNQWYWGSLSARLNGKPFGFNIGHGFGDTSAATENVIYYDGKAHKLEEMQFVIPQDKIGDLDHSIDDKCYMQPWKFVSSDGRLDMDFFPVLDRQSGLKVGNYYSVQHQVFGMFAGTAVLDDGTKLPFSDCFGFAEKVSNSW